MLSCIIPVLAYDQGWINDLFLTSIVLLYLNHFQKARSWRRKIEKGGDKRSTTAGVFLLFSRDEEEEDSSEDDECNSNICRLQKDDIFIDSSETTRRFNRSSSSTRSVGSFRYSSMVKSQSESSLFSPKSCCICCENYKRGDDIAWSKNQNCSHAFHVDCISLWLMEHDDCPICREKYLISSDDA